MKRKVILKAVYVFFTILFSINLYSQNIISRDLLDYPNGDIPGICDTDPTDPDCIITLPPALIEEDYYFQIPLISEPRSNCSFTVIQTTPCESGSPIPNSTSGELDMPAASRCNPLGENNYLEIEVIVNIISGPNIGDGDNLKYRLPVYRNPLKVVLVLDISESMGQIVSGGTETCWNVLKNSVNLFTSEFEKYYQEGDSISVIYYSEDTVMPDSPIDSNFIAITPEDFTPSNLKSSEIINANMLNRTLQDSAAMGNALLHAKAKLQNTDATKVVILFTDGYQSKDPFIHEYLGNKLYNGEFLNDGPCDALDSIRYYTVGMGSNGSTPTVLENISLASAAKNINTTTGEVSDPNLFDFFQNHFNDLLKGNRPAIDTRIIDISPFDDSLNVPVTNDLKVYFNETVTANSGFLTIKRTFDDSEFESISVSSGNVLGSGTSVITINPDNDLESNTEYYIEIDGTAFKNSDDETVTVISDKTYWNFTTEDILSPSLTISSLENNPTNTDPFEINLEFNEEINGFDLSEITVTNGVANNLATTDSISFTADISPAEDGLITVSVIADVVTDNAGNINTESNIFEINFDSSAPSIAISSVENNPTNTDPFEINLEFNEEINGFDLSEITVTNGVANNLATTDSISFTADISPEEDGLITVSVIADVVTDNAGNINTESNNFEINFDSTAPSIAISSVENNPTNTDPFEIDLEFNEEINGFDLSEITVTNGVANNLATTDSISFTADISPTEDGLITVSVNANVVTDNAGNLNTESNNFEINFDSSVPSIAISSVENNPTNTDPFEINVEFNEEINGFDLSEITVTNGVANNLATTDSISFTADISPTEDGLITVSVNANVVTDNAGNLNNESNIFEINFDSNAPSITISSVENNPTNTDPFEINVEFDEEINGFDLSEITVTNGVASKLATTDSISFTADISPTEDGLITISVNADVVTDNAGNLNNESNNFEILCDFTRPSVSLSSDNDTTTSAQFNTYVNFSEKISSFNDSKISVTNGNVNSLSTSDSIDFVASITAIAQGETNINVGGDQITDLAGNMNTPADELTITYYSPTSIEILEKAGISIYVYEGFIIVKFLKPNSRNFKSGNIEIYSLNGSLVKKVNLENNSVFRIYLNDQRGIYLVKLTLDNKSYFAKIQN